MKTINSVSGGKSSAYMALHYPADVCIFAAVLTDDPACVIADKALRGYAQSKIPWFDWNRGGCRELDLTLLNLQRLEQEMGREIQWVAAPFTFDAMIRGDIENPVARCFSRSKTASAMLPNQRTRFCTQALKLYPIFWHCWLEGDGDICLMNIGFRWDERQRVERWTCKNDRIEYTPHCDIDGNYKGKHRRVSLEWRTPQFPMYQDRIDRAAVVKFWKSKGWQWPTVSNCDFCFFHRPAEHQHQALHYPARAQWWEQMEQVAGATFGTRPIGDLINPNQGDLFGADLGQFSCMCGD